MQSLTNPYDHHKKRITQKTFVVDEEKNVFLLCSGNDVILSAFSTVITT